MFTRVPLSEFMVTQPCSRANCVDMLCAECGWEGHCEPKDAPWPVFQTHACKMRVENKMGKD